MVDLVIYTSVSVILGKSVTQYVACLMLNKCDHLSKNLQFVQLKENEFYYEKRQFSSRPLLREAISKPLYTICLLNIFVLQWQHYIAVDINKSLSCIHLLSQILTQLTNANRT